MPPTFIVDAYNLIRRLVPGETLERSLGEARATLESKLRTFRRAHGRGTRIILVYDGSAGAPPEREGEPGFEVRFSRPPRKADDVVLDLARRLEGEGDVHVVSSDEHDIGRRIEGLRLRRLTAGDFAALVERRIAGSAGRSAGGGAGGGAGGRAGGEEPRKPRAVSPEEARAWVEEFGFGDDGGGT